MVRNIKIVDIYASEETTRADEGEQVQANEHEQTKEPDVAFFETTIDTEEDAADAESAAAADATAVEEPSPKPIDVPKTKNNKTNRYAYYI